MTTRSLVMGILNRTPDSFYDRRQVLGPRLVLRPGRARLVADGADLLDVGGVKAGPGPEVSEAEELDRVVPAIAGLARSLRRGPVGRHVAGDRGRRGLRVGAVVGNDISGFADPAYLAPRPPPERPSSPLTFVCDLASPTPTPTTTTSWQRWPRFWSTGPTGPARPASRTRVSSSTPGSTWARPPTQSATLLRASDRSGRAGLAAASLGVQQAIPGCPVRSRGRRAGGRHHGGPRPRGEPRLPDPSGPRRPGGTASLRHPEPP